jgi:PAS domain S-box-containing protein
MGSTCAVSVVKPLDTSDENCEVVTHGSAGIQLANTSIQPGGTTTPTKGKAMESKQSSNHRLSVSGRGILKNSTDSPKHGNATTIPGVVSTPGSGRALLRERKTGSLRNVMPHGTGGKHRRYASYASSVSKKGSTAEELQEEIARTKKLIRGFTVRKLSEERKNVGADRMVTSWAATLDNFSEGALIINSGCEILYANGAVARLFEYALEELIGNDIKTIINTKLFDRKTLVKLTDEKDPVVSSVNDFETTTKSNRIIYLSLSYGRMATDAADKYYGHLIFLKDVTKEKLLADVYDALLPRYILEKVQSGQTDLIEEMPMAIGFCDIKGSTEKSKQMQPRESATLKKELFEKFDDFTDEFGVTKIETAGDCYVVACGFPGDQSPANSVVGFMMEALDFAAELKSDMRAGVHYGKIAVAVIGRKLPRLAVSGEVVNIAARFEQNSEAGKVNVSQEIERMLDKNSFVVKARGKINMKDYPNTDAYFVSRIESVADSLIEEEQLL